jgi:hypothetical protein
MRRFVKLAVLAGLAALVVSSAPDIKRYLKMRSM